MPDVCPLDVICALDMITVHSLFTWTPQQPLLLPSYKCSRTMRQVEIINFTLVLDSSVVISITKPKISLVMGSKSVYLSSEWKEREKSTSERRKWGTLCCLVLFFLAPCVFARVGWDLERKMKYLAEHQLQSTEHSCLHRSHKHTKRQTFNSGGFKWASGVQIGKNLLSKAND